MIKVCTSIYINTIFDTANIIILHTKYLSLRYYYISFLENYIWQIQYNMEKKQISSNLIVFSFVFLFIDADANEERENMTA